MFFSIIMILRSSSHSSKLADGIFLSAWWTPQEACVFQFQIRSTSKTPAFSTVLVYLCIILGTCTSVFRSVAKSWYLINVAILIHTKEHPTTNISAEKDLLSNNIVHVPRMTTCSVVAKTIHHPPSGGGDPTNTQTTTKKQWGWRPHKHTCSDLLGLLCVSCLSPGTISTAVLM